MIPTVLAILIYQILAIMGGEAISQIVTSIAYKRRDLDFRLMYTQSLLDLLSNYNRFDKKLRHKATITLFVCVAIALKFIPTIFTKLNSPGFIYLRLPSTPLLQQDAVSMYGWPSSMPIFNNFVSFLSNDSFDDMMVHYIQENLRQNTTQNSNGHWFRPQADINRYDWNDRQTSDQGGFNIVDGDNITNTFIALGDPLPNTPLSSGFTLSLCLNGYVENVIKNFTETNGMPIRAAKSYNRVCYPLYDERLSIIMPGSRRTGYKTSLLDANDTMFRSPILSTGTLASGLVGVNIRNHNATHLSMGVKKSAHITLYSFDKAAILPSNCSSEGRDNYTNNFIDLPYNGILCDMMKVMNNPGNVSVVQAARRISRSNYQIVMVYTHHRGLSYERGDRIMIDYTMFQVFNVEGVLPDKNERLVAYESRMLPLDDPQEGPIAVDLSDDKIGRLLKELDPSYIDQQSIDYLVRMASMRVRWENGDYSDFALTKALVINAVETPTWWITTVTLLFVAFLAPQATRLIVRRIPEYSKDLRTLMLLTLKNSPEFRGTSKAKTVGISVNELDNTADRVALLTVNGYPVAIGEKVDSSEARLIDEGIDRFKIKLDRYDLH